MRTLVIVCVMLLVFLSIRSAANDLAIQKDFSKNDLRVALLLVRLTNVADLIAISTDKERSETIARNRDQTLQIGDELEKLADIEQICRLYDAELSNIEATGGIGTSYHPEYKRLKACRELLEIIKNNRPNKPDIETPRKPSD